jgi:hypothetical protein
MSDRIQCTEPLRGSENPTFSMTPPEVCEPKRLKVRNIEASCSLGMYAGLRTALTAPAYSCSVECQRL